MEEKEAVGAMYCERLGDLLQRSNFVTLAVSLTPQTQGLIRRQERGAKGVALQTSPATYRYSGVMGLFPGPPEKGGLELGPTRNQTRPEPEFEFSAKRR